MSIASTPGEAWDGWRLTCVQAGQLTAWYTIGPQVAHRQHRSGACFAWHSAASSGSASTRSTGFCADLRHLRIPASHGHQWAPALDRNLEVDWRINATHVTLLYHMFHWNLCAMRGFCWCRDRRRITRARPTARRRKGVSCDGPYPPLIAL